MGWLRDGAPDHEGYLVALIEGGGGWRWREIQYPDHEPRRRPIARFKVACECGWRSREFHAPSRAEWFPHYLELHDEALEDAARALWSLHLDDDVTNPALANLLLRAVR